MPDSGLDEGLRRIGLARQQHQLSLNLGNLGLDDPALAALVSQLVDLPWLRVLDLRGNDFTALPPSIRDLTGLIEINLLGTRLQQLPATIGQLHQLERLLLSGSAINDLPVELCRLSELTELQLAETPLRRLPEAFGELTRLTRLNLSGTGLLSLPESFGQLSRLRGLNLSNTLLSALPETFGDLAGLEQLTLERSPVAALPESFGRLAKLRLLELSRTALTRLPDSFGGLAALQRLELAWTELTALPPSFGDLSRLRTLNLGHTPLPELPDSFGRLGQLTELDLGDTQLRRIPGPAAGNLTSLNLNRSLIDTVPEGLRSAPNQNRLELSGTRLHQLPDWIGELTGLTHLDLSLTKVSTLPPSMESLPRLISLDLSATEITELPEWFGGLVHLQDLYLSRARLGTLPVSLVDLGELRRLYLDQTQLVELPAWIHELRQLTVIDLSGNELTSLPVELTYLTQLSSVNVADNPLSLELSAAAADGTRELLAFLRAGQDDLVRLREAKLLLVGEGEVGKSSLLAALNGEPFREHRDSTHGIQTKPLTVWHSGIEYTLNGWDFGGQKFYRNTHQIFFSQPAVYLVVWKPREGPELGQVAEWIQMIRHRAGDQARVHVVATHGGPTQRSAQLDRDGLIRRFGSMIVDFHHVDSSQVGPESGIPQLKRAVAATVAALPHISRDYPRTWLALRNRILEDPDRPPYLSYDEFEELAAAPDLQLSPDSARSLAKSANAMGHWVYFADDLLLSRFIVLRADWLSAAIGLVLDDTHTVAVGGLLDHARLRELWDNPLRPRHRYSDYLQGMFLRLMERYGLSYRVADTRSDLELSLVPELLSLNRPDDSLRRAWDQAMKDSPELTQVCHFLDRTEHTEELPLGLMNRLIVRFHRSSLGTQNFREAVHWRQGVLLRDRYGARALLETDGKRLTVRVRGVNPQAFLNRLVDDVRDYAEDFWDGIETAVSVPCRPDFCLGTPGRGLFDLDVLYKRLDRHRTHVECGVHGCDPERDDFEIETVLGNLGRRPDSTEGRLAQVVSEVIGGALERQTAQLVNVQLRSVEILGSAISELDTDVRSTFSVVQDRLDTVLRALADEAVDGPRLFGIEELDRDVLHPKITHRRIRITLYCEHSRLPLHVLESEPGFGVHVIDVPKEWWARTAPVLRTITQLISILLPVSAAGVQSMLTDQQWASVQEQVQLGQASLDATSQTVASFVLPAGASAPELSESLTVVTATGGLLRNLHALLREKDPGLSDLRRVLDPQRRFLWVHRTFEGEY
jgi:Leucine-rich repeat (LRR) protein